MTRSYNFTIALILGTLLGCGEAADTAQDTSPVKSNKKMFSLLTPEHTGLNFYNVLQGEEKLDVFNYINFYNGGGVALGDVNNDGLIDIYLTGNMVDNKLFINKGDLQFEDVTTTAKVEGGGGWCTGVTMVDINTDGWMDIYVARSYTDLEPDLRRNLLYVNNQDGTFSEKAAEYGIDDVRYSTHATFFDYDKDDDLDLYVGNHPRDHVTDNRYGKFFNPKDDESDQLYRNNGDGTFTNVTAEAGITNWGFLLGVVAADLNDDGWQDIYIANDHAEPDLLYMNNGDGTFTNKANESLAHMSNFSMGVDVSDFNNDGYLDVVVLDMMAEDNYREKTNMPPMAPEQFWEYVEEGYGHQYMRNVLQLNNGNGSFSEIGQMAGMHKTDWSWAALFADYNNDGFKDLFVSNGYKLDYNNKDFIKKSDKMIAQRSKQGRDFDYEEMFELIDQTKLKNYMFSNNGDLTFTNRSFEYGVATPSFSNGAAYGDLDNDGDLDLVVNNLVEAPFLYQNNATEVNDHNWLMVHLTGPATNPLGLGARVEVFSGQGKQMQEYTLTRGFQSSVAPGLHFGFGTDEPSSLRVIWPDGKVQTLNSVEVNGVTSLNYADATTGRIDEEEPDLLFTEVSGTGLDFVHEENLFDDFVKEILLPHKMSQFGPFLATGDVNGDGTDDVFIGGAAGQAGVLYTQTAGGTFKRAQRFTGEAESEDMGATFFDADGDGDLDLYVVSGGNEFQNNERELQDRLYLNKSGKFVISGTALPQMGSGSCVVPADFDNDGDLDLFVGARVQPGKYPLPPKSCILRNDGGIFNDITAEIAPELETAGMVTSAVWTDFDGSGTLDLLVVGEWMPISFFSNEDGKFTNVTSNLAMTNTVGWWNRIVANDIDGDGDMDYIAGNLGTNYKYKASFEEPTHIYAHDFDNSGTLDIVLGYYNGGACFPVRGRQCSSDQMPNIKDKFPTYHEFGSATIEDVYGDQLEEALHYAASEFRSVVIRNENGKFNIEPLPVEAQIAPINAIIATDITGNGADDLLVAGNLFVSEVETGRADAGIGLLLTNNGQGEYTPVSVTESGFFARGDVKDMVLVSAGNINLVIVANNDAPLKILKLKDNSKGIALK